ncbi:MAG: isopenicillin N synthase family oxygenase [Proteobacteria bacterium]|nr:isopenicillin N synthase family oxygenase [Pseudomonadota bacterium]
MTAQLARISLAEFAADPARHREIARVVDRSLQELGFFVITDHGVPRGLIDATVTAANDFFDRPMDEKQAIRSQVQGSPRGYLPMGLETLASSLGHKTPPDIKEGFGMGPLGVAAEKAVIAGIGATYTPNRWPARPSDFRDTVTAYYQAMERLTALLMELFAAALSLPPHFFADRFSAHNSTLRLMNYPAQSAAPAPGQLRAGAHTDYSALTILLGQDRPGGLQVRRPDGTWIDARTAPHDFVINVGDLMMAWSNDTWLSNMHRVANPPAGTGDEARRLSIAYFCNPNDDLLIECLPTCCGPERAAKYPAFRAGEHRFRKIEASKAALAAAERGA